MVFFIYHDNPEVVTIPILLCTLTDAACEGELVFIDTMYLYRYAEGFGGEGHPIFPMGGAVSTDLGQLQFRTGLYSAYRPLRQYVSLESRVGYYLNARWLVGGFGRVHSYTTVDGHYQVVAAQVGPSVQFYHRPNDYGWVGVELYCGLGYEVELDWDGSIWRGYTGSAGLRLSIGG